MFVYGHSCEERARFPFLPRITPRVFPACPAYDGPKVFACVVATESDWAVPCIEHAQFGIGGGLILIENKNGGLIRPFFATET